jgi:hypothetical protein
MNCSRNDVVLLPIPFTDLTSRKVRPAIIIGRSGADLFLVPISSVLWQFMLTLAHFIASGTPPRQLRDGSRVQTNASAA